MRLRAVAAVAVGSIVIAIAAVQLTADRRAEGARHTLEDAAARFDACYERDRSYARCDAGSSGLSVSSQTRTTYTLVAGVEFGPNYSIMRVRGGRLERRCRPAGDRCPIEGWRD